MKQYEYHKSQNNSKETIVCLAGATEGAFRFYDCLDILTQQFNVILFNNPGVDGNVDDIFFTTEDLAEKYLNILDSLKIKSFYMVGHSMGGFIAQKMAIAHPEKVKKLVVFGATLGSYNSMDNFEYLRYKKELSKIEDFSFTSEFQKENPDYIEKYLKEKKELYKLPRKSVFANFLCGAQHSVIGETDKLTMPVLVIQGTADLLTPKNLAMQFTKTLPNGSIWLIKGAGHNPFNEDPSIMRKVIEFFLQSDLEIGTKVEKIDLPQAELEKDLAFRENIASLEFLQRVQKYFKFDEIQSTLEEYSAKYYN